MAKFRLGDDGTMDTVVVCTDCGGELRYTFEPHEPEEGGTPENKQYDEFVAWAIEDAESEHECPPAMSTLLDCGHQLMSDTTTGGTGYGQDGDGRRYCYACCADRDRAQMLRDGRTTLYRAGSEVTNWPGSLRFRVGRKKTGRHNMAGHRYDVWFAGPDGATWHGVTYGDNTQICHCRRVKA